MGGGPDVTGRATRPFLILVALTMANGAIVFFLRPPQIGSVKMPSDARSLAARIARHPTDWAAASALAEVSLDTKRTNRVVLWRAAYEHASMLAPERKEPATGFARAAFFHWTELSEKDKHDALAAYAPQLRDPNIFGRMAQPLFELTGDLSMLRRSGPSTADASAALISLALANGLFADYRALRAELQQKRIDNVNELQHTDTPEELVARFPGPPYHTDAEPLIRAFLDELRRRPLVDNPNRADVIDAVVDYALRHNLGPLDGLEIITRKPGAATVATQIKLARALGLKQQTAQLQFASNDPRHVPPNESDWQGLCQNDLCGRAWRMIEAEHGIALTITTVRTDNVQAYVEIYVDDALRAEGEVGPKRDFVVPVGNRGTHRIEVVLANPITRNQLARRVHIASITTL
jgi:hypothetical protein